MGWLEGLAALTSGGIRGWQEGKEEQRAIAEARRRALMEERELNLREKEAISLDALRSAQARLAAAQGASVVGEESRAQGGYMEGRQAIDPATLPPELRRFAPGNITRNDFRSNLELYRRILDTEADSARLAEEHRFRVENPEVYGGSRIPKTPDEMAAQWYNTILSGQPPLGMFDKDQIDEYLQTKLKFLFGNPMFRNWYNQQNTPFGTNTPPNAMGNPSTPGVDDPGGLYR